MAHPVCALVAEFAQDEGPVCRACVGQTPPGLDVEAFVLRTMSVDVAHTEDWATLLELGELRAYVLHLALADLGARGFVRPLALALVAPRARLQGPALHAVLPALAHALHVLAQTLKAPAQTQFERELAQRVRDLRATWLALQREGPPTALTPSSVQDALHELQQLKGALPEDEGNQGQVLQSLPRGRFSEPLRPLALLLGPAWDHALHALTLLPALLTPSAPASPLTLTLGGGALGDLGLRQTWGSVEEERFASASEEEEEEEGDEEGEQALPPPPSPHAPVADPEALWAWREEKWPCAPALVHALLRGRALVLLVPPPERSEAERTVRALAHFVALPALTPGPVVQPWRTEPLSVAALGTLRLVALPPGLVAPPVRRVALVLAWELRRTPTALTLAPPAPGTLAWRLLGGTWPGPSALARHVQAQLSEAAGACALAFHAAAAHVLARARPQAEAQRLRGLDEALGSFLAQLRVPGDDAAVLRHWLQVLVNGGATALDTPSRR